MTELLLLRILSIHAHFTRYSRFIKKHILSNESKLLFEAFDKYYSKHPSDMDWTRFKAMFTLELHPAMSPEKMEIYTKILSNLEETEYDENTLDDVIKIFIKRDYFSQIADIAMEVAEGESNEDSDRLKALLEQYETETGKIDELKSGFCTTDLTELVEELYSGNAMEWRMEELNISVGTPRGLIVIPARKDGGKSTIMASETTHMLSQTDRNLLWFTNEETQKDVMLKLTQAIIGKPREWIRDNPIQAMKLRDAIVKPEQILVKDKADHIQDILEILKHTNPGIVVIDQLWNCKGFEKQAPNEVSRKGALFGAMRRAAQEYDCPIFAAHQLGGAAEGQRYPDMSMLYESQTAIQAHADLILAIGKTNESGFETTRWLNILASKLGTGPRVNPALMHGQFEVKIRPDIARFEGDIPCKSSK